MQEDGEHRMMGKECQKVIVTMKESADLLLFSGDKDLDNPSAFFVDLSARVVSNSSNSSPHCSVAGDTEQGEGKSIASVMLLGGLMSIFDNTMPSSVSSRRAASPVESSDVDRCKFSYIPRLSPWALARRQVCTLTGISAFASDGIALTPSLGLLLALGESCFSKGVRSNEMSLAAEAVPFGTRDTAPKASINS